MALMNQYTMLCGQRTAMLEFMILSVHMFKADHFWVRKLVRYLEYFKHAVTSTQHFDFEPLLLKVDFHPRLYPITNQSFIFFY